MNKTISLLGGLLLTSALVGQEQPPTSQEPSVTTASAADRMTDLQTELQTIVQTWREESRRRAREAEDAGEGEAIVAISMRPPLEPIPLKALNIAKDYAGTDDAVVFLVFALQLGMQFDTDTGLKALDVLASDHAKHDAVIEMAQHFDEITEALGPDKVQPIAAKIAKANPQLSGWIALSQMGPTIDKATRNSSEYAEAKANLLKLAKEHAASAPELTAAIEARIRLREQLGVGGSAPDIVGVDLDGTEFKLSDYRGKVIFLDFWGDW